MRVTIKTTQKVVNNRQDFDVDTTILNFGTKQRHFHILYVSYDQHWSSDSPLVQITPIACTANPLINVVLKPGQAYSRKLSIRVTLNSAELQRDSITFRLAFSPADGSFTIWSNQISLRVRK